MNEFRHAGISALSDVFCRKYLKLDSDDIAIDEAKIEEEARYDGKWVLLTNTDLPADMVALKYKELWQVDKRLSGT